MFPLPWNFKCQLAATTISALPLPSCHPTTMRLSFVTGDCLGAGIKEKEKYKTKQNKKTRGFTPLFLFCKCPLSHSLDEEYVTSLEALSAHI